MRGLKLSGMGLLTVLVLSLAVMPASAAWAKKALELSVEETPVAVGGAGDTAILLDGCTLYNSGTLNSNGAAKDILTATSNVVDECPEGEEKSISGLINETQLGASGKFALKGTVTLTTPGPCVYTFTKFKGTFEIPSSLVFPGSSSGKLNRTASSPTCAKKITEGYLAAVSEEPFNEFYEAAAAT